MEKLFFCLDCSCGKGRAVPITREQSEMEPAAILHSFDAEIAKYIAEFWSSHMRIGHKLDPSVTTFQPMPEA